MAIKQAHVELAAGALLGGLLGKALSKYVFEEEGSCLPYVLTGAGVGVLIASTRHTPQAITARANGGMIVSKDAEQMMAAINPDQLFAPLEAETVKIGDVGPNPKVVNFYKGK